MSKNLTKLLLAGWLLTISVTGFAEPSAEDFLATYRGRVVLVDFWASWCGPCRRSFPWMNQMFDKYEGSDFTIVAVNVDASTEDAAAFLAENSARFAIEYDPDGKLAEFFGVEAMPSSFLLDASGKVVAQHKGFQLKHVARYEQLLRQQLEHSDL